jgi:hypothetical protein
MESEAESLVFFCRFALGLFVLIGFMALVGNGIGKLVIWKYPHLKECVERHTSLEPEKKEFTV